MMPTIILIFLVHTLNLTYQDHHFITSTFFETSNIFFPIFTLSSGCSKQKRTFASSHHHMHLNYLLLCPHILPSFLLLRVAPCTRSNNSPGSCIINAFSVDHSLQILFTPSYKNPSSDLTVPSSYTTSLLFYTVKLNAKAIFPLYNRSSYVPDSTLHGIYITKSNGSLHHQIQWSVLSPHINWSISNI